MSNIDIICNHAKNLKGFSSVRELYENCIVFSEYSSTFYLVTNNDILLLRESDGCEEVRKVYETKEEFFASIRRMKTAFGINYIIYELSVEDATKLECMLELTS